MAKAKKGAKPASIHSRAARRETSPSINTDKSLKAVPLPADDKKFTVVQNDSGVKKRKGKAMSRNKRVRHEKGMQRAEAVLDQLEKKVETSGKRGKTVKERSFNWDEVNERLGEKKKGKTLPAGDGPQDDGNDMEVVESNPVPPVTVTEQQDTVPEAIPVSAAMEEEEELDVIL